MYKIEFDNLEWESPLPGARFKAFCRDGKQLRLVEFTDAFVEPDWCEKGHAGMVLEGELEVDYETHKLRYPAGTAILIPPGPESRHKARSITPVVRLFLVEEV